MAKVSFLEKLDSKSLNKVEIAYRIAQLPLNNLKKDTETKEQKDSDSMKYLIDAIKYVVNGNEN